MNIVLTGKHLKLTNALEEMVKKELAFLEGVLPQDKVVNVTLESHPEQKATVLFYHEQDVVRISESGKDLYDVFPQLAKKVEKHLRKFNKMKRAFNKGRREEDLTAMVADEDEEKPSVTKRKRFEMKPMSEEEAILQTTALGHPQFIFSNTDLNGRICLLYTRRDGDFGVIETTI